MRCCLLWPVMWSLLACGASSPDRESEEGWPQFRDRAVDAGLVESIRGGSRYKGDILEANTGGVAIFDYDGDGDRDLFFVNGGPTPDVDEIPRSILYRNDGDGRFSNVTEKACAGVASWGMGVAVWDVDGDDWPDLYLTAWGSNTLLHNRGDGSFETVADAGGMDQEQWSSGIGAADYDLDGDVDVYLAQYVDRPADRPIASSPPCTWRGIDAFCGPAGMAAAADRVFERTWDGGSYFRDVSDEALSGLPGAYGLGAVAGDLDDDGDTDLYVANDATPNYLFRNDVISGSAWQGRLNEIGASAAVSASGDGRNQAGMGIAIGDVDGDGAQDLLVSNFSHDHVALYRQSSPMQFSETAFGSDLGRRTLATLGWGTGLVDFDHDGDLDVFIANGHVYPEVDDAGIGTRYRQPNQVFRNDRGHFREVSNLSGRALQYAASSRGAAFGDLDDDGDVDVVVVNLDTLPSLLIHQGVEAGWLTVQLRGGPRNRSAVGAQVRVVVSDELSLHREVRAGTGYLSQDDHRLHFGTARADSVDVHVRWPGEPWLRVGRFAVRQHLRIDRTQTGP